VTVNADKLIADVLAAVDKLKIDPPRIVAEKAIVESAAGEDKLEAKLVGHGILATLVGRHAVPNLVEMLEDLIAHITPPVKLTRRTLAAIITRTKNCQAASTTRRSSPPRRPVSSGRKPFSSWWTASSTKRTVNGMR
jgi:hypothetical protein